MILTYVDNFEKPAECTIEEAVKNECDTPIEDIGIIENLIENGSALSRVVGLLVQHMHDHGLIDTDFLLNDILQGGYEKKEE